MKASKTRNIKWFEIAAIMAILVAMTQASALAEVTDSSASGFTVKLTVNIHASAADVYHKLIHNVGDWWNSAHTLSGDAHNLSIDERPMGCFCEKLPNQGAVRHMEVLYYAPGKLLRMSGVPGPMQGMATTGVATFTLAPSGDTTDLTLEYAMGGYSPKGLNALAPIVDMVFKEQITRLKNYVETGKPDAK